MNSADFLEAVQAFAARGSVGASTVRGQGAGVAAAAREYLATLDLGPFATSHAAEFHDALDAATLCLRAALPRNSRNWGISRKVLNIFLRNTLYSVHLADRYRLAQAEAFFELPMDSISVSHLCARAERGALPRWRGVKHLTPEVSAVYQDCARRVARQWRIAPVHLDAIWWGTRPDSRVA